MTVAENLIDKVNNMQKHTSIVFPETGELQGTENKGVIVQNRMKGWMCSRNTAMEMSKTEVHK